MKYGNINHKMIDLNTSTTVVGPILFLPMSLSEQVHSGDMPPLICCQSELLKPVGLSSSGVMKRGSALSERGFRDGLR